MGFQSFRSPTLPVVRTQALAGSPSRALRSMMTPPRPASAAAWVGARSRSAYRTSASGSDPARFSTSRGAATPDPSATPRSVRDAAPRGRASMASPASSRCLRPFATELMPLVVRQALKRSQAPPWPGVSRTVRGVSRLQHAFGGSSYSPEQLESDDGNGGKPSSFRNSLCFLAVVRIMFSIFTNSP